MIRPSNDITAGSTGIDTEITAEEARRLQLRAQGLLGADGRRGGVPGMLGRLGAVQLDTISVLARSHELVPYARLGPVGRDRIEAAYWGLPKGRAATFEYWCHAACVLPVEDWPYYAFRRRAVRRREKRWHDVPKDALGDVLARLKSDGPLTATQLGGAKAGGPWWDWSATKIAVEWLLDIGEVACVRRTGWRRVYDLTERALPARLLDQEPGDEACISHLAGVAGRALGVATRADLVDFLRLRREHAAVLDGLLADGAAGLVPVTVTGWPAPGAGRGEPGGRPGRVGRGDPSGRPGQVGRGEPGGRPGRVGRGEPGGRPGRVGRGEQAWADPRALAAPVRGRHRTTLLSPFDSLVWDRKRASRMFGFDHRLEAYVPKDKRVHGYFAMPLLSGGRLIGRVDPAREGGTLIARRVSFEPSALRTAARTRAAVGALCDALWEAAGWVGCHDVRVEVVDPPELAATVRAAAAAT